MPQSKIVPVVEGKEPKTRQEAVVVLLERLLRLKLGDRFDVGIAPAKYAGSRSKLTREAGLETFLQYARREPNCAGILVLLDAEEECVVSLAYHLAERAKKLYPPVPTVIVCAKCEYEAWFLASLESIRGKELDGRPGLRADAHYDKPVEALRDVKGWLSDQMPPGHRYKETLDPLPLTRLLDFDLARQRSRSFRRLEHALDELLAAIDRRSPVVTPQRPPM